jgi:hypothetical protein
LSARLTEGAVPDARPAIESVVFIILRVRFRCAALTGVEASPRHPAFKKPESRNASATLMWMALILGVFFIGMTILAHQLGVQHSDEVSAPAQIARTVFGHSPLFYAVQTATALILVLAANTSYADFPRLGSILARDRFLPHQFTFRGDRLAFSNGIIVLGGAAALLLVAFEADVDRLIPLYSVGVFVSFTLSQSGMVVHWLRLESGWQRSIVINAVGAVATASSRHRRRHEVPRARGSACWRCSSWHSPSWRSTGITRASSASSPCRAARSSRRARGSGRWCSCPSTRSIAPSCAPSTTHGRCRRT